MRLPNRKELNRVCVDVAACTFAGQLDNNGFALAEVELADGHMNPFNSW